MSAQVLTMTWRYLLPMVVLVLGIAAYAAPLTGTLQVSGVVEIIGEGKVDWAQEEIRARGIGLAPEGMSGPRATALAREAAIVVAERNLLKVLHGVRIDSQTTVSQLMLKDDTITERVEGFLRGTVILREKDLGGGAYEVVVGLPIFGKEHSVAETMRLDTLLPPAPITPELPVIAPIAPAVPVIQGNFTGLLIDCRGLHAAPAMCPVIRSEHETVIYPRQQVAQEVLLEQGVAGYYRSPAEAKADGRVGNYPLVITAVNVIGGEVIQTNPVVRAEDAARIIAEDERTHFLDRLAVGIIIDPQ